ncbi:salivary alpha-glucosidase-like isoform X2 [Glandiceps talaboti]
MSENDAEKGHMDEEKPVVNHEGEPKTEEEAKDKLLDEKADAVYSKDGAADPGAVHVKLSTVKHAGLDKEQLMEQCNTPMWKAVRIILLVVFWLAFVAMLVAVIILVATAPKCPTNKAWYQTGVSYQVYPRSFKDSDGDGHGDLKGIEYKVPYLQDLGIETLWLGAIYPSPMEDMGRDVTNYTDVHEDYGTLEDFKSLLAKIHSEGMRLVLEFIPNHSSDQHDWFEMSMSSKNNPYSDYYVWADSPTDKPGKPPSNWLSRYGGSAWTFSDVRNQWYLHTFGKNEPDLNFRSENVTREIADAMKFWLELGVDGFYLPYANQLMENAILTYDEQDNIYFKSHVNDTKTPYEKLLHNNTRDQPETHDLLATWRSLMNSYSGPDTDDYKVLVAGAPSSSIESQMEYYGSKKKEADYAFNFQLMDLCTGFPKTGGHKISSLVKPWLNAKSSGKISNWALGDSDHTRVATRCGSHMLKAMNTLMLTLPGSATAYYGDEIGIEDLDIDSSKSLDPSVSVNTVVYYNLTRDRFVSPMQWTSGDLAGFTNGSESWTNVNDNYVSNNVDSQVNDTTSSLSKFKELISLVRAQPSLIGGTMREMLVSDTIYSFVRVFDRWPGYFVAINFDSRPNLRPFSSLEKELPTRCKVVFATHTTYKAGEVIDFNSLLLDAYEAVVVQYER